MSKLVPSLLSADFYNLEESLKTLKENKIEVLHLDVMDGAFVPNISFGQGIIANLRNRCDFEFDVHLMIEHPELHISSFAEAGADIITVHYEASKHIHRTLQNIRSLGKKAGVSLNPGTPLESLKYILPDVDLILIMSVNPGFGGQTFIPQCLEKLIETKNMIRESGYNILLEIDGGIKTNNLEQIIKAGADYIVAGSDVFGAKNVSNRIQEYYHIMDLPL